MVKLQTLIGLATLLGLCFNAGCKKEEVSRQLPLAKAGTDTTLVIGGICTSLVDLHELDGSGSTDPDNDILSYKWRQISGPTTMIFSSPSEAKTFVSYITPGLYLIELTVTDAFGLASKDSVRINAVLSDSFNLDVEISGTFEFSDNAEICPFECHFGDEVVVRAAGTTPVGEMTIVTREETDTAWQSYWPTYWPSTGYTFFLLSDTEYIGGKSFFYLKQVIQQGGGSFSGSVTFEYGSAKACNNNIFVSLPPLVISGTVDIQTRRVKMRLKGQILF